MYRSGKKVPPDSKEIVDGAPSSTELLMLLGFSDLNVIKME
jgi:hypothetical protein